MKSFRTASILILTLALALAACGSSKTTSDGAAEDATTDSTIDVTGVDGSTAATEPGATTNPNATAPGANTNPTTTAPTATAPAGQKPKINSFSVGAAPICFPEVPDYVYPTTITASWDVSGATSIYVAIGDESGAFEQNLSASGSTAVPTQYPCLDDPADMVPMTYYLVAENAAGRTVEQETR